MIGFLEVCDPHDWRLRGACNGLDDPDLMFPAPFNVARENDAKDVCVPCPVRTECLGWALDTRQQHGVWGGLTEHERAELGGRKPAIDPDTADALDQKRRAGFGDCGTMTAYRRHKKRHEAIDPKCREAHAEHERARRAARREAVAA